jgi:hypothetical protein
VLSTTQQLKRTTVCLSSMQCASFINHPTARVLVLVRVCAQSQVSTEDVIRTGPGLTGWSRSYDSCCAAANESGVLSTAWASTEYESAFIGKDYASVVAITRPLARVSRDVVSVSVSAAQAEDDDGKVDSVDTSLCRATTLTLADPKAAFYLARCIDGGVGCDNDNDNDTVLDEAEELFRALVPLLTPLAVAGDPAAQFALGECYYNGSGVDEDEVAGKMWYKSAALGGHTEALWAARAFGLL